MTVPSNYFYDGQTRRYISQFIRLMSDFHVSFGTDRNGNVKYQRVPVMYGDQSRQAAAILRNNSENTLNSVPAMSVYVGALTYDQPRLQDPTMVQTMQIRQRKYDSVTGTYASSEGQSYTVERKMPVPYKLTLKLDIWTSNTEQKFQIWEQISQLFNPSLELQSTDNYIDWTSLTTVTLTDMTFDSRTVPTGAEEPISILTMTFEVPIWISTNIKVKKLGVIHQVFTNMADLESLNMFAQTTVSVNNYSLLLSNDTSNNFTLKLLKPTEAANVIEYGVDSVNSHHSWSQFLHEYGKYRAGISEIRLTTPNDSEIIGTIAINPLDDSVMMYTPFNNTLPANTLDPINAIIDPLSVNVASLVSPATGTRYLLINDIGSFDNGSEGAIAWKGTGGEDLVAKANDIIQYNGSYWQVVFDSVSSNELEYVTNLTTMIQYKWSDRQWTKSYDGVYHAGEWMIVL